jgi:hypothetical protein
MGMNGAEREKLKDNLRSMSAGRGDGIELDTEYRWVVSGISHPEPFFRSLFLLLPQDTVLYFEGCSVSSDVSMFYETHRASEAVAVARDSVYPTPECFHVAFSAEVIARLCELVASRPSDDLFDHIKAYRGESLLFDFHDAFNNHFLISDLIPEPAVAEFSSRFAASYRREANVNKRDPEQLRKFLLALENPHKIKIRIAGESWWRRVWRRFK